MEKKGLWIALIAAIIIGSLWQFFPLSDASERLSQLPLSGEHFLGQDVPLTPFEEHIFSGVNVIKRIYEINGEQFFLTVIDGTHNRHIVHDPTYCFRGSGWSFTHKKTIHIEKGSARLLTLVRGGEKKQALYWFSDGEKRYDSPVHYWWDATLRRMTLGYSGEEPVLVVMQPVDKEKINWKMILSDFTPIFNL